ncbi:MAG: type IV toxin-antitoxin system AbiEi family antitoxin [Bacteroidota bacterium]|nr:type IV toxin-antitoxin system AbiEi family antitoxin [Bacteroidota bacterium]
MSIQKETKLKTLFKVLQPGKVVNASYLESIGISRDLQKYYLKSGWLESVGRGAYKKTNDTIEWQGALSAIQTQTEINVHVGALSALYLQGFSHYFRFNKNTLYLFSPLKTKLPKWFTDYKWRDEIFHKQSSFLSSDKALREFDANKIALTISTPERAIMECIFLAPNNIDLVECYYLLEGLVNLKPNLLSELLVNCKSVKVKRLFLYMAEKANHQWFQFLKTDLIDLGKGNRMLIKKGVYNSKYLISIPKELEEL